MSGIVYCKDSRDSDHVRFRKRLKLIYVYYSGGMCRERLVFMIALPRYLHLFTSGGVWGIHCRYMVRVGVVGCPVSGTTSLQGRVLCVTFPLVEMFSSAISVR